VNVALAPFRMAAEMAEQPAVLRRLVARRTGVHNQITHALPEGLAGVAFVGRGSSANAAMAARVMIELATRKPVVMVSPSIDRLYGAHTDYFGHLAVGLSFSGHTPEVVSTLLDLQDRGAATIAITGDAESPLAEAAGLTIDLGTGPELAVPTTKGFTAELAMLVILAETLGGTPLPHEAWAAVADVTQQVLEDAAATKEVARDLAAAQHVSVVGAGTYLGIAHEIALKFEEAALLAASAHSSASYRHGPIAMASTAQPLVALVGPGSAGADTTQLAAEAARNGAPVVTIGPSGTIPVPDGLPEWLASIPMAVRGQQLALAIATEKGLDPDQPPTLSKVTLT
jgi:glucosamine--fructose-6-phosphate aminotransferase (isomerizing)